MNSLVIDSVRKNAERFGHDPATLLSFIEVETGGLGFDSATGKLIIQFEPAWFKKKAPFAPSGLWSVNRVERQTAEWIAFNDAFSKNPEAAMESTSIGIGQIMGLHFKRLGFSNVQLMWHDAEVGIDNQIVQLCKFIETDNRLKSALKARDWNMVATIYNGAGYKALATKYNREPYDQSLAKAFTKYSSN